MSEHIGERPIGYWLKHLDNLIDKRFTDSLAAQQVTRRQWQVLNVLQAGPATGPGLVAAMQPFQQEGEDGPAAVAALLMRGWIRRDADGALAMTAEGLACHARVAESVQTIRQRSAERISRADYDTALAVLQQMAANLSAVDVNVEV